MQTELYIARDGDAEVHLFYGRPEWHEDKDEWLSSSAANMHHRCLGMYWEQISLRDLPLRAMVKLTGAAVFEMAVAA